MTRDHDGHCAEGEHRIKTASPWGLKANETSVVKGGAR